MIVFMLAVACEPYKGECDPADTRTWIRDEDGDAWGVQVQGCYDP
jgi:hypothetical protein